MGFFSDLSKGDAKPVPAPADHVFTEAQAAIALPAPKPAKAKTTRKKADAAELPLLSEPRTLKPGAGPVIHDLLQGTDEWFAARCGLLTASEMKLISRRP